MQKLTAAEIEERLDAMVEGSAPKTFNYKHILGVGGFGEVWSVTKKNSEQIVALKMMKSPGPSGNKATLKEVEVMKLCKDSPLFPQFHGLFLEAKDKYAIEMEYMKGTDCSNLKGQYQLYNEELAYITKEVLQGLDFLHHTVSIIHQDIKPSNIVVDVNGAVKIIDFGLSIRCDEKKTKSGTTLYKAPEMFQKDYNHKVDIWALGITIFSMVEEYDPYTCKRALTMEELEKIIKEARNIPRLSIKHDEYMRNFQELCTFRSASLRPEAPILLKHPWMLDAMDANLEKIGNVVKAAKKANGDADKDTNESKATLAISFSSDSDDNSEADASDHDHDSVNDEVHDGDDSDGKDDKFHAKVPVPVPPLTDELTFRSS